MYSLVALLAIGQLSLLSAEHAIRHDGTALFTNDGRKIVDFGMQFAYGGSRKTRCSSDNSECVHETEYGDKLTVKDYSTVCKIVVHDTNATDATQDCFSLGDYHWFGGAEEYNQYWPLENTPSLSHVVVPVNIKNRAVNDALWYNSAGDLIYADKGAPLFYELKTVENDSLCLIGNLSEPYRARSRLSYSYYVCSLSNAKQAYQYAMKNFISKPSGYPVEDMIRYPIWSTWARYKTYINDSVVRKFAKEIKSYGFNGSNLEIDDKWETCYGSAIFDTDRFPSMKNLSDHLHDLGFYVTLWTHFFVNLDCEAWKAAYNAGYFVEDSDGNANTTWWNGNGSVVDFTKTIAKDWWVNRTKVMMEENGIDAMKFDAGEITYLPEAPVLNITASLTEDYPGQFTEDYIRAVAEFGNRSEFRSARYTQDLPVFLRMIDKDSKWGIDNGLKSLVTTLLQLNSVGYSMILPDMIGGNAYDNDTVTKELFIRWLQANTFMPSLQFSYVPWDFDNETVAIALKYTKLHAQYTDSIITAMKNSVKNGTPVNPPIWWIDPTDEKALNESTEFLLGEDILVAPVLDEGATTRDIYLPTGSWLDGNNNTVYDGPITLTNYPAPLETLPYFLRISTTTTTTSSPSGADSTAFSLITIFIIVPLTLLMPQIH